MTKAHTIPKVAASLCVHASSASPGTATFQTRANVDFGGPLGRLDEQGCNVPGVKAAVERGDYETAEVLMQQFMGGDKGELHALLEGAADGKPGIRTTGYTDQPQEQGFTVPADRTAVKEADNKTAEVLMQQFVGGTKKNCMRYLRTLHTKNLEYVRQDTSTGLKGRDSPSLSAGRPWRKETIRPHEPSAAVHGGGTNTNCMHHPGVDMRGFSRHAWHEPGRCGVKPPIRNHEGSAR